MNIQLFSQLIKDIYSLCLDQDRLVKVLNEFVILFNCQSVALRVYDHQDYVVVGGFVSTCTASDEAFFKSSFGELQPYLKSHKEIERKLDGGAVYLFQGSEFFPFSSDANGLQENLSNDDMFSLLFREGAFLLQLVIRQKSNTPFAYVDLAKYSNALLPHIHKAYELFHALEKTKGYSAGFEQAMDRINSGLIMFDRRMSPVYKNRKAEEVLAHVRELSISSDKVSASTPQESVQLRGLISTAITSSENQEKDIGIMTLQTQDSMHRNLVLIAIPLHPRVLSLLDGETGVFAALMIGVVQNNSEVDPDILHLLYGLTQSEAKLAVCLADGKSLEQCSEVHGISLNTARSYLKIIFQKTGTSRQAELVALVKTIPVINGSTYYE